MPRDYDDACVPMLNKRKQSIVSLVALINLKFAHVKQRSLVYTDLLSSFSIYLHYFACSDRFTWRCSWLRILCEVNLDFLEEKWTPGEMMKPT